MCRRNGHLSHLIDHNLSADVTECMTKNGINGDLFMELTEGDFKEMAPRIADRILLSFIQQAHRTDEAGKEGTTGPLTLYRRMLQICNI